MEREAPTVSLFLCGDVMTGRGIDQILQHPSDPTIHEAYMTSAVAYVEIAERLHGPIPKPVSSGYIWGDALDEIQKRSPHVRVINLETSVTTSDEAAPKGINYRMHPGNVGCLQAARIDCCVLANNHILDWGPAGLIETVDTLRRSDIATTGAGRSAEEAALPASLPLPNGGRILIFSFGSVTSGIASGWEASPRRPGVHYLADLSRQTLRQAIDEVRQHRREGDLVVASIHWGENWGYAIPRSRRDFAQGLLDSGAVDLVHGHSSHHPKGIEVYGGKLILYGCGDFINDYEGITGHGEYRPDLVLAYFASLDPVTGHLRRMEMVPFRSRRFRLERAGMDDTRWLCDRLSSEGKKLGTSADLTGEGILRLRW